MSMDRTTLQRVNGCVEVHFQQEPQGYSRRVQGTDQPAAAPVRVSAASWTVLLALVQAEIVEAIELTLERPNAPMFIRAEQPSAAASLGVLLVAYSYFAYTFARYSGGFGDCRHRPRYAELRLTHGPVGRRQRGPAAVPLRAAARSPRSGQGGHHPCARRSKAPGLRRATRHTSPARRTSRKPPELVENRVDAPPERPPTRR